MTVPASAILAGALFPSDAHPAINKVAAASATLLSLEVWFTLLLPQKVRSGKDSMDRRSDGKAGPLLLPTVCSPLYVAFALVDSVGVAGEGLKPIA
jgi:hypothetical protein